MTTTTPRSRSLDPHINPPTPEEERLAQALIDREPGSGPAMLKIRTNTYGAPKDRVFDVGRGLYFEIEE